MEKSTADDQVIFNKSTPCELTVNCSNQSKRKERFFPTSEKSTLVDQVKIQQINPIRTKRKLLSHFSVTSDLQISDRKLKQKQQNRSIVRSYALLQ